MYQLLKDYPNDQDLGAHVRNNKPLKIMYYILQDTPNDQELGKLIRKNLTEQYNSLSYKTKLNINSHNLKL